MKNQTLSLLLLLLVLSCKNEPNTAIPQEPTSTQKVQKDIYIPEFQKLSTSQTGVNFTNILNDQEDMNIFSYEYMYNGAGVAAGDINNDGLTDLYFSCNQCPNRLFLNKGNFQFHDITEQAGVKALGKFKTGVAMVDINSDGYLDIFALRSGDDALIDRRNYLFINNGNLTFSNKSTTLGLDEPTNTTHCNFIDFDRDGDLDVFYGNHPLDLATNNQYRVQKVGGKFIIQDQATNEQEDNKLFRNDGDMFVSVGKQVGISKRGFALSSVVSDFNDDGYPDLYIGNDYIDPDQLLINQKNNRFKNEFKKYFNIMSQNTMGSDYEDVNGDGFFDLMTLDMLADTRVRRNELVLNMKRDYFDQGIEFGYGAQVVKNTLQINQGNGKYIDQSHLAGVAATDWSWSTLLEDFNNDGSPDIYVTNGFKRDISDLDFMDYRDKNLTTGFKADNINDFLKIIPSKKVSNKFFVNKGNGDFIPATKDAKLFHMAFSHGAVYTDLDNDGDLDLVVNNMNEPASIYKNLTRENRPDESNYLQVQFIGPPGNHYGVNAVVHVTSADLNIKKEYRPVKGYMSSVEPKLFFGLGDRENIDQLIIKWPNGRMEVKKDLPVNQVITLNYGDAKKNPKSLPKPKSIFRKSSVKGITYKHVDKKFNDFHREPLLMYKLSDTGPALTSGDINGDGLEDIYIGGGMKQNGTIFLQLQQGGFGGSMSLQKKSEAQFEDSDAAFFDADGDGDLDLYVVSGGSEYTHQATNHRDRLYINDGKGGFEKSNNIPDLKDNGSCVSAGDFDGDGDLDLFVGSRGIPGRFPEIPTSRLLENKDGKFIDVGDVYGSAISRVGMVTDAQWADLDKDGKDELFVIGEWMPLKVFGFVDGKIQNKTNQLGLDKYYGLWQKLKIEDLDGDGDLDIIAGNFGENTRFKASKDQPMTCYGGDFDDNGFLDPILSMYSEGKNYPVARRDIITSRLPKLKKKFTTHKDYATATVDKLFDSDILSKVPIHTVNELRSGIFQNNNGQFSFQAFPMQAQAFPVRAISFDKSNKEIILAGQIEGMEVINGPYTGSVGMTLKYIDGKWQALLPSETGLRIPYSTNEMQWIEGPDNKDILIIANHNGPVMAVERVN